MCRIIALAPSPDDSIPGPLTEFGRLADCGAVPPDAPSGHRDGWGLAGFSGPSLAFRARQAADASADPSYGEALGALAATRPDLVLGHLRKMSVGVASEANTQPFVRDGVAFCHNGTVYGRVPLDAALEETLEGETDSERILQLILEVRAGGATLAGSVETAVRMIRRTLDYSAMNLILTDGRELVAVREANESGLGASLRDSYYTLSYAVRADGRLAAVCSEEITLPAARWMPIQNHSVITATLGPDSSFRITIL